jgi:hypothetical protein
VSSELLAKEGGQRSYRLLHRNRIQFLEGPRKGILEAEQSPRLEFLMRRGCSSNRGPCGSNAWEPRVRLRWHRPVSARTGCIERAASELPAIPSKPFDLTRRRYGIFKSMR